MGEVEAGEKGSRSSLRRPTGAQTEGCACSSIETAEDEARGAEQTLFGS